MSLSASALDLLFPPKCPFCQKILEEPRAPVCPECQRKLPWLEGKRGERRVDFAENCFSPLAYRDSVPGAVHRMKFSRVRAYAPLFGQLMAQCLADHLEERAGALTWAPLSRQRLRERGFDQAELMARAAAEELGVPCVSALKKVRDTAPQSGLEEESARRANVLGVYLLRPEADIEGKVLVLADDVVTSGSTLSECARILRQGGARRVYCLTLAQARSGPGDKISHEKMEK